MDLNQHIYKFDDNKPFHSNGYAVAANGDQLGAVSSESFSQRQQINQNRQIVGGYNRSAIGQSYNEALRAKPIGRGISPIGRGSLQAFNSLNPRPAGFREPPARKYNPYA